jgi:branched chain amino acid efflux pump
VTRQQPSPGTPTVPTPNPTVPAQPGTAAAGTQPGGGRGTRAVLRDSLAVGTAVGISGVAFGGTASAAGLSVAQACALSLLAFTGASQFALVATVASGGNPLLGSAGAILLGARNGLYGMRLRPLLGLSRWRSLASAHLVVDETTAVTLAQPGRRSARLGFTATGVTLFTLWNATTLAGALGAAALGSPARYGLDAAGPAVFLALLAPMVRRGRAERCAALAAAVIAVAATPLLPPGVPILLALAAAGVAMALPGPGKDGPR